MTSRRRYLVLAICCMSLFIVGMDATIVNVALPSIGRDFHAPVSGLQWTVDSYLLVIASLLMLSGSVADRVGRRMVFQIGLAVFTLGSLACSVAPSLGALVAFRAVQAVGGSMLNPVAMSIVTNTFTDPKERAKAIGFWGSTFGVSVATGPVIGGALVDSVGWRGVFWVNIPVGVAAIILTALYVPESRAAIKRKLDPVGQVLVMLTLVTLTYGDHRGPVPRLVVPADPRLLRDRGGRAGGAARVGAEAGRAADRPAVLPLPAVLRGGRDGDHGDGRVLRVPVPDHALPAGGARVPAAGGGPVPAPDGGGDGGLGAAVRPDCSPAAGPGRRC